MESRVYPGGKVQTAIGSFNAKAPRVETRGAFFWSSAIAREALALAAASREQHAAQSHDQQGNCSRLGNVDECTVERAAGADVDSASVQDAVTRAGRYENRNLEHTARARRIPLERDGSELEGAAGRQARREASCADVLNARPRIDGASEGNAERATRCGRVADDGQSSRNAAVVNADTAAQ